MYFCIGFNSLTRCKFRQNMNTELVLDKIADAICSYVQEDECFEMTVKIIVDQEEVTVTEI